MNDQQKENMSISECQKLNSNNGEGTQTQANGMNRDFHEIYTGDMLGSGSSGNDVGDVPCSRQMPFPLYIPHSYLGL